MEWKETGIDVDHDKHEQYLNEFRRTVSVMIRNAIDLSLSNDPDGGKQRKKTVQVSKHMKMSTTIGIENHNVAPKNLSLSVYTTKT